MALGVRSGACATLLLAGLGVSACGSSSPTILNTEKVERAIEASSLAQRGLRATVSCPAGVHQAKGRSFSCTAVVKGDTTRFAVSQLDDAGHVRYAAR
jgi:uncharacterized protein DUF4333